MTALDELGLAQNTIVVLWGDHGLWCKHCNFETSLHVPLIIKDPRLEGGKTSEEIVEFVDLYPTLCDLCDLSLSGHIEGNSFANVLKDPKNATTDGIAVCRWGDGFTLVQDRYFYTEWWDNADNVYADMLFDHKIDPHENKNIIFKEKYQHITDSLGKILIKNRGDNFDE